MVLANNKLCVVGAGETDDSRLEMLAQPTK